MPNRTVYPDHVRRQAIDLYLGEQISAAAVAERMGLKSFTVKEWLSKAGVIRSMSEAAALSVATGRSRVRASSRLWYESTKTGEQCFAESSLEFLRMQQLDADDLVATWSRCSHRIEYVSPDGKARRYVPDLIVTSVSGATRIEEVKPSALVDTPLNQAKFAACRAFCEAQGWTFLIVTEGDVGYARALAPSSMTKQERRRRENEKRRQRWASETPEQRAARLKHNADYMREFNRKRKSEVGTNVPTGLLRIQLPRT